MRDGGAVGKRLAKKVPPGQTLFSHFLFSGAPVKGFENFSRRVLLIPGIFPGPAFGSLQISVLLLMNQSHSLYLDALSKHSQGSL